MDFAGKVIATVVVGVFALAVIVVFSAVLAWPVMLLWNGVTPNLVVGGLKQIDFWNAWGLLILAGLLFKGNSSSSSS